MNYYNRHLGDYARDAGHLTALEHGIYNLLIDWYYVNEQPIPDGKAHRFARCEPGQVRAVLEEFFTLDGDCWRHKRIDREIAEYRAKADRNREIAEKREAARKAAREAQDSAPAEHEPCTSRAPVVHEACTTGQPSQKPIANSQDKLLRAGACAPPGDVNPTAWADWEHHRRKRRKPISERAAREQWAALSTLTHDQQAACIAASIRNDWQGLFPEKFTAQPRASPDGTRARSIADDLTDTSWAHP